MRKQLLLPLLLALAGCQDPAETKRLQDAADQEKKAAAKKRADEAEYRKELSLAPQMPLIERDAALGLKFGAPKAVVQAKLYQMGQTNKVYLKNVGPQTGAFFLVNYLDGSQHEALLGFDWLDDSLSGMTLNFMDEECDSAVNKIVALYTQKYGAPRSTYYDDATYQTHTVWLKGGRKIDVSCDRSTPVVSYSAVGMMERKQKADAVEKASRPAKTLQEL